MPEISFLAVFSTKNNSWNDGYFRLKESVNRIPFTGKIMLIAASIVLVATTNPKVCAGLCNC